VIRSSPPVGVGVGVGGAGTGAMTSPAAPTEHKPD